jgi:uncharacterized protein
MALPLQKEATVPVAEIISQLESRTRSDAALRAAVARADEIAPAVIELVEAAADGVYLIPKQAQLLFWGIHVLAAAPRTELFRPLIRLLRARTAKHVEQMLGPTTTETLSSVVISAFDGAYDALIEACADPSLGTDTRWSLIEALARLTFDGAVPREAMLAFLDRFEREPLAEPGDDLWYAWQTAISLLGFEEMRERIVAASRDGRLIQEEDELQEHQHQLTLAQNLAPGDASLFVRARLIPLDDLVEALVWIKTAEDDRVSSQQRPFDPDPAETVRLAPYELQWLQDFFSASGCDGLLEFLDGFYCGIIAGPGSVQAREYVSKIWEVDKNAPAPRYDNALQAEYVTNLLTRHWNSIARRVNDYYRHVPVLDDAPDRPEGKFWALGFLRAVTLRIEAWKLERGSFDQAIPALMALADRRPFARIGVKERCEIIDLLPDMILSTYDRWHGGRDPLVRPRLTGDLPVKIGRNEPCPCGAKAPAGVAIKYKRCCGS